MSSPPLRLLLGVDFSAESLSALRSARRLARRVGGELTIAHVRPSSDIRAAVLEERGDLLRQAAGGLARRMATHYEKRLAKLLRSRGRESVRLLSGEPARELCREASRGYDLLALGSRGRGAAAAFFLGSTVQEALVRSPIPVLVLPAC